MEVRTNYVQLVKRLLASKQKGPGNLTGTAPVRHERNEISRFAGRLKIEIEKLSAEPPLLQAARMQELAGQINSGVYKVDTVRLAGAMLDPEQKGP